MILGKNLEMDELPSKAISGIIREKFSMLKLNKRNSKLHKISTMVDFIINDVNGLIPVINEIR